MNTTACVTLCIVFILFRFFTLCIVFFTLSIFYAVWIVYAFEITSFIIFVSDICVKNCVHEKLLYVLQPTKLGVTIREILVTVCKKCAFKIFSVNSIKLTGTDNHKNYRGCDAVVLVSVILRKNMFHLVSTFYGFLINLRWWWKVNAEMNWQWSCAESNVRNWWMISTCAMCNPPSAGDLFISSVYLSLTYVCMYVYFCWGILNVSKSS